MMTIKHTSAPWQLTFGEHDAAIHAGATIAMVDDTMGGWKANAFLIAAAPELLDALQAVADDEVAMQGFHEQFRATIRAAIAKAKGDA